jgi:hypothetical protein
VLRIHGIMVWIRIWIRGFIFVAGRYGFRFGSYCFRHWPCCFLKVHLGSMALWCGSGSESADSYLWLVGTDSDSDPTVFVIDLVAFWRYTYTILKDIRIRIRIHMFLGIPDPNP